MQRRLGEEYERCQNYLDSSTRKPLVAAAEEQLLAAHMAALLERGFDALMAQARVADLARLYALCGRIGALELLRAAFRSYIKKAGLALIMDEEKVSKALPPPEPCHLLGPRACKGLSEFKVQQHTACSAYMPAVRLARIMNEEKVW